MLTNQAERIIRAFVRKKLLQLPGEIGLGQQPAYFQAQMVSGQRLGEKIIRPGF